MKRVFEALIILFNGVYFLTIPIVGSIIIVRYFLEYLIEKGVLNLSVSTTQAWSMVIGLIVGLYPLIEYVIRKKPWLDEKYEIKRKSVE